MMAITTSNSTSVNAFRKLQPFRRSLMTQLLPNGEGKAGATRLRCLKSYQTKSPAPNFLEEQFVICTVRFEKHGVLQSTAPVNTHRQPLMVRRANNDALRPARGILRGGFCSLIHIPVTAAQ